MSLVRYNTPIVKLSNSFTTNLQIRKLTESSPQDSTTCQPLSNSDIKSRTCVGGLQHSKAKKKVKHFSTKCDQNFKRMQIFFHFTPNPRKTPTLDIRRHSNQIKKTLSDETWQNTLSLIREAFLSLASLFQTSRKCLRNESPIGS